MIFFYYLKGKLILSINNVKEIRDLYSGFHREKVSTSYQTPKEGNKKVSELLIMNFKPSRK